MPRCLVVQHVEPEEPYAIGRALEAAGSAVVPCRVFAGEAVPDDLDGFDGLVVMGGPSSAAHDDGFPTRRRELALLEDAVARDIPTLGVCLGAQLLALAAGGSVYPGQDGAEIGWGPVVLADRAGSDLLLGGLPGELVVLHWHGDTFDLPPGATRLASNARYANQAFRLGDRAWGLQFHVEVDRTAVDAFLRVFGEDARAVGSAPEAIGSSADGYLEALAPARDRIAARFAGLVAGLHRDPELVELR
ncbi:MAG: type 1 glutamine amidotransferase [Acidimicrobiales bacterium]